MERFEHAISQSLRAVALALPETTEGTSCVNRAFKVGKKNFLFLGEKPDGSIRVMLKLDGSAKAAKDLMDPRVVVGKTGWVTIVFDPDDPVDVSRLEAWVRESFETFASKRVLKQLE